MNDKADESAYRLCRPFLANGVSVALNATSTKLTHSYYGAGTLTFEANENGLVITRAGALPRHVQDATAPRGVA